MISNFSQKETSFEATLKDGRTVELFLRPYSLADMAWSQENFKTKEDAADIKAMKVVPCAKLIWRQLNAESKKIFMEFEFVEEDDEGNNVPIKPEGYQRFINAVSDMNGVFDGYAAFAESMEKNGFLPSDSKKKILTK